MSTVETPERQSLQDKEHISLCETLDRVLNKGVVVAGEVVISVANIDLIYLGLQLVLTSTETASRLRITEISGGLEENDERNGTFDGGITVPKYLCPPARSLPRD